MYGTIAKLRVKEGMEEDFLSQARAEDQLAIAGYLGSSIYRMNADPRELYVVVAFESKDAYVKNADSPDQDARYRRLLALLETEPEWHDGEIIDSHRR